MVELCPKKVGKTYRGTLHPQRGEVKENGRNLVCQAVCVIAFLRRCRTLQS